MRAKCWLLGDSAPRDFSNIIKAARLRDLPVENAGKLLDVPGESADLICINLRDLYCLSPNDGADLSRRLVNGATCYIGGGLSEGQPCSLAPFAPINFRIEVDNAISGYTFTSHKLLPNVLRDEKVSGQFRIPVAHGLSECGQALALSHGVDGSLHPIIFAIEHGAGLVICDLSGCTPRAAVDNGNPEPSCLVRLLENPTTRLPAVGAIAAVDHAAGRGADLPVACDIVIDDRPVNFDYFNVAALRGFLEPLVRQCPDIHVDFGWTPDQSRPSHLYVDTLKRFNVGFVWHGLLHHIDHRTIGEPETDFAEGRRLVEDISRRYRVKFQPVMVFPYEKDTEDCVTLLKREGFIAKAETPDYTKRTITGKSAEFELVQDAESLSFATLTRDSIERLSRDRMLARAAIGLPIILAAHPHDISLRRLARLRPNQGSVSQLGGFLEFITSKGLRPQPLEQIARDLLASRVNYG